MGAIKVKQAIIAFPITNIFSNTHRDFRKSGRGLLLAYAYDT